MRIITSAFLDMERMEWVWAHSYEYIGPVAMVKGDSIAKQEEASQAAFTDTLNQIFTQQYGTQQSQLKYLQSQLQPLINEGGQGYTPEQLTSLRTSATDTNAQQFQNAEAALNNQISQESGGSPLAGVSGAVVQEKAALDAAEAQQEAQSQAQITQQNAQLQQQNYWNAVNALNGVAVQENPLGYAGAVQGGGQTVTGLSQAVTAANQSQLLGALGGIASGAGSALGGVLTKGCWIAASFFGWADIRTFIIRVWLHTTAPRWFRSLYMAKGSQIANTPLRWAFLPIFEYVLWAKG